MMIDGLHLIVGIYFHFIIKNMMKKSNCIHFNQAYIDDFIKEDDIKKNNIVIFNFEVENLESEYQRIQSLQIGEVSKIMYVNVHMPYYYFNVIDPDGNVLEITGNYSTKKETIE